MFKQGRKSKQFFQCFFPNYKQMFKKMTEDSLAWQYQLEIKYSNDKDLIFNFSVLMKKV